MASEDKRLQIILLGLPQVRLEGRPLPIPRRNVRGLLYYLAVQAKAVGRDPLCLLFWPDIPEENARRNLTRLMTHLRRALPRPEALVVAEERVSLDRDFFWCDAAEFLTLSSGDSPQHALQRCVELYGGSFLAGFNLPDCPEYENWLTQERATLENLHLKALSELIEIETRDQDYAGAIRYAQRYLEVDAFAEEVHRRLMVLYALAGERTRALRQYETCITVLENELGARPLPETQSVYRAILDGKPQDYREEGISDIRLSWISRLRLDIPLVGRSQVLATLERLFIKVKTGQSGVVLITGEPGIGKTRLLHSLITKCQHQALVLYGSGDLGEATLPYHPIVEALHTSPFTCPASLAPVWLSEVSRLLPEINSLQPDLPPPVSLKGDEARTRLFEALCQFISALQADYGPVLLCLDNLHWFDRTSLSWLIHFCRQHLLKSKQILLVGTYRSEDAPNLEELRGSLSRLGLLNEIQLTGLDQRNVGELLDHLLAHAPGKEALASRLREATGGNPFFILETLRTLEEENKLAGELGELVELPLPDSVREAINRRLGRLHAGARQVLETGAILGAQFGFKTVRATAGRSDMETAIGLDELVQRQLLTKIEDDFHFSHDLVRKATAAATSPIRLKLLHKRAGRALEKIEPEATTAIARHFDASGEWEKALHYYRLAVQKAEALFAWQEAISHYDRMIGLLEMIDPDKARPEYIQQRGKILGRSVLLHHNQGNLTGRDERLKQHQALADSSHHKPLELDHQLLRARYLHLDGHYAEALEAAEQGLVLAHELKDFNARCRLLAQTGLIYFFLGKAELALSKLEAAKALTDANQDLELRAIVLGRLAFVKCLFGKYREALDCQKEAHACYQRLGNDYFAAQHLTEIGDIYASLAQYTESRQALTEILELTRKTSLRSDEGHTLLAMGWLHVCEGNYEKAVRVYTEALDILYTLQSHHLTSTTETALGVAFYHLGDYEKSLAWLEKGLDRARRIKFRVRVAEALILMALVKIANGQLEDSKDHLGEGSALARETHSAELAAAGLTVAARIERQAGNLSGALAHVEEALD